MPTTTTGRSTSTARRRPWLAALTLGAVLVTGCTAGQNDSGVPPVNDKPSPTATAQSGGATGEDPMTAFRRCMREQGVPVDDDGGTGLTQAGGEDDPNLQAAAAQCRHLLEGSGISFEAGGASDMLSAEQLEGLVNYAGCMRDNGIAVPDPEPSSGGLLSGPGGEQGVDTHSPAFKEAHAKCESHLPGADAENTE